MRVVVRTPVCGYTPGQTIKVEIEVDNKSETDAEFSVQLMKVRLPPSTTALPLRLRLD